MCDRCGYGEGGKVGTPALPCSAGTNIPLGALLSTLQGDSQSSSLTKPSLAGWLAGTTEVLWWSGRWRRSRRSCFHWKEEWKVSQKISGCILSILALCTCLKAIFVTSHNLPRKERRSEGIYFIRPGSRLVQLQGRTDVAEVMFELVFEQSQLKNKIYIFLISTLYIQVVQHSSLLEHSGNVTALSLSGKEILISGSRDRLVISFVDNAWMVLIVFDFSLKFSGQSISTSLPGGRNRK